MPIRAKQYRPHRTPVSTSTAPEARGTRHDRGYNSRWSRVSKLYLLRNPLCVLCADKGRVTRARCVDHIDGLGPLGPLGYDETNFQPLCQSCHSRKTVNQDGGFGRKPKASSSRY